MTLKAGPPRGGPNSSIAGGEPRQIEFWRTLGALRALSGEAADRVVRALAGCERLDVATIRGKAGFSCSRDAVSAAETLVAHGLARRDELPAQHGGNPAFAYRLDRNGFRDLARNLTIFAEAI